MAEPFYSQGLRWACTRCSHCCRHEEGYVFLSQNDLELLASYHKMPKEHFILTFCRRIKAAPGLEYLSLKETSNRDCFFWKEGCSVYEARPLQCRSFPFWEGFLRGTETWKSISEYCPGIGSGRIYRRGEIENFLRLERESPPVAYVS